MFSEPEISQTSSIAKLIKVEGSVSFMECAHAYVLEVVSNVPSAARETFLNGEGTVGYDLQSK